MRPVPPSLTANKPYKNSGKYKFKGAGQLIKYGRL